MSVVEQTSNLESGKMLSRDKMKADGSSIDPWRHLLAQLTGYRRTCLLIAAAELGILEYLQRKPCTSRQISARAGISEVAAQVLLNSLVAIDILQCEGEKFGLADHYQPLFDVKKKSFLPNILLYRQEAEVWLDMADIMRGNKQPPDEYSRELFGGRISLYEGIEMLNRRHADKVLVEIADVVKTAREVIDIGGAEGYYASRILALNPNAKLTILDLEDAFDPCRNRYGDLIGTGRLVLKCADARTHVERDRYDLVMMHELLELFPKEEKERIVANAIASLAPGGVLLITKFPLLEDGQRPAWSALFSVRMCMKFRDSYLETDRETHEILRTCLPAGVIRQIDATKTIFLAFKPTS